ncbi:MAG: DUF3553 domain-containing protein [Deltaproteobacteria bacterium]|nr:DUF3553 domain-containing protein [Deltaproteobacteria bacterium]
MDYKKGEMVKHPGMPEWGLGKVLEDSRDYKVRIFFTGDGWKTLSLKHVEPVKISGKEARHPILDHLWAKEGGGSKYQRFETSKEMFLKDYPDGFYDPAYLKGERNHKVAAHELALSLIGPEQLKALLSQKDYEEISKRALKVVTATNLISPNEKLALKNGLKDPESRELFSENLYQLLYGKEDVKDRFIAFARALEAIKAAKWTTLSYFLFIVFPEKYIFIKPIVTEPAAEISAFEINYRPDLNWRTYKSVLDFSEYFWSELKDLKPRDMIDIQSFMWRIGPNK